MLSALGQCGRDSGVALGLPECPGLVVWGPILKGEKKKKPVEATRDHSTTLSCLHSECICS